MSSVAGRCCARRHDRHDSERMLPGPRVMSASRRSALLFGGASTTCGELRRDQHPTVDRLFRTRSEHTRLGYGRAMHEGKPKGPHGYSADKPALLARLRRVEGQIRGLQRMVDEDTYCIDVLTQISAAKSALQAVAVGLLEDHLAHCVVDAARAGDPSAKVKEASDAIARLVKS